MYTIYKSRVRMDFTIEEQGKMFKVVKGSSLDKRLSSHIESKVIENAVIYVTPHAYYQ